MTSWRTSTAPMAHQTAAADKLQGLRVGALFQDPGTGKSRTGIELACRRQHRIRRVVWLAPVAAKETVRQEILKHTSHGAQDIHVFDERTRSDRLPDAHWYVVGTESLSSSDRVTLALHALIDERTLVIGDESDMLRTPQARRTLRATLLARPAWGRLIMTGTPVPEGVPNLYAQMRFLDERILGYRSWYGFAQAHIEWSEQFRGQVRRVVGQDDLARRIAPYTYQITREACLDLPAQIWDQAWCTLSPAQMDAYARARAELLDEVPDAMLTSTHIYRLFTALHQIASGFWNRRDPRTGLVSLETYPHARLATLLATVARVPAGEKVIVWCKYHRSVQAVVAALTPLGGVAEHHGQQGQPQRAAALAAWRRADGPRFLVGTPGTGGRALTLNEASWTAFYERGFSYTENYQAELRNHRIGSPRKVTYLDVRAVCGIEDRIAAAYARKSSVSAVFRAEVERVKNRRLVRERLAGLFGP
jgi:SNF2 family DNA or RNA helicase